MIQILGAFWGVIYGSGSNNASDTIQQQSQTVTPHAVPLLSENSNTRAAVVQSTTLQEAPNGSETRASTEKANQAANDDCIEPTDDLCQTIANVYIIAISGCGGGNKGPQEIYRYLEKACQSHSLKIVRFDTLPDDELGNVDGVSNIALEIIRSGGNIYVVGHSMGGGVAALAAHQLNQIHPRTVKGLVLIDTQTEGLQVLQRLVIPVLFYHGREDEIFPVWQIESHYQRYSGPKRMVEIKDLDHNLRHVRYPTKSEVYTRDLALDLFSEITDFFFTRGVKKEEIVTRELVLTHKTEVKEKIKDPLK